MFQRLAPLLLAAMAALALATTATGQAPVDPASKVWDKEINGQVIKGGAFLFTPFEPGGTSGGWMSITNGNIIGWGVYTWDPVSGVLEYVNQSDDGGGGQSGVYSWTGTEYKRTWASSPQAPPMRLL